MTFVGGYGQYGNPYSRIDLRTGQGVGLQRDAQGRYDPQTGLVNHGASAKANLKEGVWDAIGAIPFVGGALNFGRGLFKSIGGLLTGNMQQAKEGVSNMGKGLMYGVLSAFPPAGMVVAGINATKNFGDAAVHGMGAARDSAQFGGFEGKRAFVYQGYQQMMMQNTGYGAGLAMSPGRQYGYSGW